MRFIDLFAGMGGTRLGFEDACRTAGISCECVFTSEIKPSAIQAYTQNFNQEDIAGDLTKINARDIPDFDFMLAGFPCQPFSSAGARHGFLDTRGTLFFDIERILKEKKPEGFLLENVDGLLNHDKHDSTLPYGRTMDIILRSLENLGYKVSYSVLNAADFGIPQNRKRIYIVGSLKHNISLKNFPINKKTLDSILEKNLPTLQTPFTQKLLSFFTPKELAGKSIKDKRGGKSNIHSWSFDLKGETSPEQKELLSILLKQRRQKKWAIKKGITWMDGMPLTLDEIKTFYPHKNLQFLLDDLVKKKYLRFEHPKDVVCVPTSDGKIKKIRQYATNKEQGYNIVTGKLSFEISKILAPDDITPTLVATDVTRLAVADGNGLRRLTVREGLRLSGFPEHYTLENIKYNDVFDLLGNTVIVPVISAVVCRYLENYQSQRRIA